MLATMSEPTCRMYGPGDRAMAGRGPCFSTRYSPPAPYRPAEPVRRCLNAPGNLLGGLDDSLLSRAGALADMGRHGVPPPQLRTDMAYGHPQPVMTSPHTPPTSLPHQVWDMMYHAGAPRPPPPPPPPPTSKTQQMCAAGMDGLQLLDASCVSGAPAAVGLPPAPDGTHHGVPPHTAAVFGHPLHPPLHPAGPDADTDPRELEAFSERFKQRRIKLGVTQADVGRALGVLRLPGVGALSQSTICRFESLTLSHNNMIALKPVLHAWLEEAEAQARDRRADPEAPSVLPGAERKRKRTSIAAPEKRSLEAFFSVQPRPSGEKIAAIAEKLDLKKNVVRVWFCNQRQKQKRMRFATQPR
ncbi:inhibitory POU protein-like [Pollicipes pollicipes]|uniref:inhibitory POU protein-like n=1 Tax=Pollicipes pollicipes TaxID=41117 RepID=UPI001885110C|nr:inhibitory POU protein-like [Pollicipes pollicipes]